MRSTFWRWMLTLCTAGIVGMIGTSVLAVPLRTSPSIIGMNTTDLPIISIHEIPTDASVKPGSAGKPTAIILVRDGETWRAFSNRSTHRGCRVEQFEQKPILYDVCYHSMWNLQNEPIAGPGPRGLDWYEVNIDEHGYAVIDLHKPNVGAWRR